MTYEEAYEALKYEIEEECNCLYIEDEINLALHAIEKQIPKKPNENRYPWCICPNCGGSVYVKHIQDHIQNAEQTYCEHCGQKIDWRLSDENYC